MGHPFYDEHEKAIEYGEFAACGWSAEAYISYCNLVSQLRAAIVVSREHPSEETLQETAQDALDNLLEWVGQACGRGKRGRKHCKQNYLTMICFTHWDARFST